MSKIILKDAFISVDGTDLSDHCTSVTIETTFDEVDQTGFGSTYKEMNQGLGDATITLNVLQDFDAASVDSVLWPLSQSGDTFTVIVRADSAAVGATNPQFNMTSRLFSYNPIAGSIGESSTTDVALRNAASTGLTRTTA
jgi:hypothetical protein